MWAVTVLGQVREFTSILWIEVEFNHDFQFRLGVLSYGCLTHKSGRELLEACANQEGLGGLSSCRHLNRRTVCGFLDWFIVVPNWVTPQNLSGTDWVEANGPKDNGLLQISTGTSALWGITRDRKCWALKGDLQDFISKSITTFDWNKIPRKLKSISVSKSDQVYSKKKVSTGVLIFHPW